MHKQYISAVLAITGLAFCIGTMAQNMSESEYKAAGKAIAIVYESARTRCDPFAGNARDICMAVANDRKKEAEDALVRAELDARSQLKIPEDIETDSELTIDAHLKAKEKSEEARKLAAVNKRDANFAAVKEKCAASAGNALVHCINEAKLQFGK